jgi:hypothetical protein
MIELMYKIFLILLTLVASLAIAKLDDNWFDPAYLEANTIHAGTGFIEVPSPEVIPGGVVSASIHSYQVKLDYGLWNLLELGFTANLDGYDVKNDASRNQLFYGRMRLLDSERFGVGLSLGVDGLGPEDFGLESFGFIPKGSLKDLQRFYVIAGGVLPFYQSLMISAGWVTSVESPALLLNISKVVLPGMLAMAEYDGRGSNLGLRILVSPQVKLDLSFYHTQDLDPSQPFARVLERNIKFGITYSEPWP